MPKDIETELHQLVGNFIWAGLTRAPIRRDILELPIREGGIGLVNIPRRNRATNAKKVALLLDLQNRPIWAHFANPLMGHHITAESGKIQDWARINVFLQQWNVATHSRTSMPNSILGMLRFAKEAHLSFTALNPSRKLVKSLPAWYHFGAKRFLKAAPNSKAALCLYKTHKVTSVGRLYKVIDRETTKPGIRKHNTRYDCACPACARDRSKGCTHPKECLKTAKIIKAEIENSKWDPWSIPEENDGLSLTRHRRRANKVALQNDDTLTFDPSVSLRGGITQGFRLFTDPKASCRDPARRKIGLVLPNEAVTAYTDGACIDNGDINARAGSGVFYGTGDTRNLSLRLPDELNSNNAGEIVAVLTLVKATPTFAPLHFETD
ncbi:hypothetical protein NEOLEDRAFT_1218614, partial [Neolentinus lepideus HHB14362 ss-1]